MSKYGTPRQKALNLTREYIIHLVTINGSKLQQVYGPATINFVLSSAIYFLSSLVNYWTRWMNVSNNLLLCSKKVNAEQFQREFVTFHIQ
jgi:hypothetical protein